jgi:hypothetical protein
VSGSTTPYQNGQRRYGLQYPFVRIEGKEGLFCLPQHKGRSPLPAFDPANDRGKGLCPDKRCGAHLTFYREMEAVAGGADGYAAHFKLKAGDHHMSACPYEAPPQDEDTPPTDPSKVDPDKGYRIHYNLAGITNQFQRASGPVITRRDDGHFEIHDADIADRERLSARTAGEFGVIMRNRDPARLRDSAIVHGQGVFPWPEFFVRTGQIGQHRSFKRWIGLAERLMDGERQPLLFAFDFAKPHTKMTETGNWKRLVIGLDPFRVVDPNDAKRVVLVQPRVVLNHKDIWQIGQTPGEYLGLCQPRLMQHPQRPDFYFLDLKINTPDNIVASNLRDWGAQATKKYPPALPAGTQAELRL